MTVARHHHWIGGRQVSPKNEKHFEDLNPLDDSLYAEIAQGDPTDVAMAVETAHESFGSYRHSLPKQREAWLVRAAELLESRSSQFIDILIDEVGSPILKAQREVETSVGILRSAAGATRQLTGKTLPTDVPGRLSMSVRRPLGVIAGISPFNVPLIKDIKHSAMPLATGNTVVLLPSEHAPVTALKVAELFADAGFPAGAFNVVTGLGADIGDTLTCHPQVRMVGFTGSSRIGHHISALCGKHAKRYSLEMGGKNPLVVLKDAELGKAVQGSVLGSFLYQGQICMASSRIYVEKSIFDDFLTKFLAAVQSLSMEDLRSPSTMIGPVIHERQRNRIKQHVADAISKGATVRCGGKWQGNCCEPTVLTGVDDQMLISHEETFGPVTTVHAVDSADEALTLANASNLGLSASIYTSNLTQAMRFAEELEAGMVHVNGTTIQDEPHIPFGGVGDSGFGRESTDPDLSELTEWKWVTVQHS
ncbi:MAG TPA: aldehyde dehydrogenase [Rhodopirellula sp.]|nr:aldehyde dehydrogenase [Rhodopirellula sp.]